MHFTRLTIALVGLLTASLAQAASFSGSADFDRWNYPFNFSPGTRTAASTFGAVGPPPGMFDDRDAQFLIGFDTSAFAASLPALGANQAYRVTSAKVNATTSTGSFTYDPTYDSHTTYGFAPTDTDAGRPVVLSGAGLRNFLGFSFAGGATPPPFFSEGSAFGFGDPRLEGVRNAFAADADGNDISNNVRDGFDINPFGVGQNAALSSGDTVVADTTLDFAIDVSDADIQSYLTSGLSSGLFFTISSLHSASQGGPTVFPAFYTRDNTGTGAIAPTLELSVAVVPEPTTALLARLAGVGLLATRRRSK